MTSSNNYSSRARKFAYRFPRLSYVGIQINFWIVAIFLYSLITYMNTAYLGQFHEITFPLSFNALLITSFSTGFVLGVILGLIDLQLNKLGIHNLAFGLVILIRIIIYPLVVFIVILFLRFFLFDLLSIFLDVDYSMLIDNPITWHYIYLSLLIYTAIMAGIISFINQMNNMFGPGVLIPLMMGKYRKPIEEQRIFMFLDLKSSVQHAEELGHLKYSALIRDCFMDLNKILQRNNAEIYQYVGDEAVITWPVDEGLRKMNCLSLFFDFKAELNKRYTYYMTTYSVLPVFKAGLHLGTITVVEVGQIKREIAYHGDTINTAARIQSVCNQYGKSLLVSNTVLSSLSDNDQYKFEYLGEIAMKGKASAVKLFGVEVN